MPDLPDLDTPFTDGQVGLRLASDWDIPDILIAFQDDPELPARLGLERPPSGAELGRAIERGPQERAAGLRAELTIVEPGSDDCRGRLDVHDVDWGHQRAALGIWVAPQARNRGLARGALALAAEWLFDATELKRLELLTDPDNDAMRRAARAAGFLEEGVRRAYERQRGRRVDLLCLSLLPGDLPGG
jgi:RimJ/RimL family protein N-acetyltransferase